MLKTVCCITKMKSADTKYSSFVYRMDGAWKSYVSSCRPCQLRPRARRDDRVPITPIVRPTVPFVVCHADVIGPIEPPSAKGHKWALTVIDDCSRWPAVFLLKNLTAKSTCDAFLELFSVTGWPEIICTDQGSNF